MIGSRLSLLWLRRGLWSELKLPLLALIVAATATTCVTGLSSSIDTAMNRAANASLGADLIVSLPTTVPQDLIHKAHRLGLSTTTVISFPSVALAGSRMHLIAVRVITNGYPLRGTVDIQGPGQTTQTAHGPPAAGTVWLTRSLLISLNLKLGQSISIGNSHFLITKLIKSAPGTALNLANVAPLVIMNRNDLSASGLGGPESRATYQLLLAGSGTALSRFRHTAPLPPSARYHDLANSLTRVNSALANISSFLTLAVLATVLIAEAALLQSVRYYTGRQQRTVSILRALGATRRVPLRLFLTEFAGISLLASMTSAIAGWAIAGGLSVLTSHWFGLSLSWPSLDSLSAAPLTVFVLGAGLWLPPLLMLLNRSPSSTRSRQKVPRFRTPLIWVCAICATSLLVLWQGKSSGHLALDLLGATLILSMILGVGGYFFLRLLSCLRVSIKPAWRYGLSQLSHHPGQSISEFIAFGITLTVMLLLTGVYQNLVSTWTTSLSGQVPNHFLIDIQPTQKAGVQRVLAHHQIIRAPFFPVVRARLTAINGAPVSAWHQRDHHNRHLIRREQNLSERSLLGVGNHLVSGRWWTLTDRGKPWVSVGSRWAKQVGVTIGDQLSFAVAGQTLRLKIVSIRHIDWKSFLPNFFLVTPPNTLSGYPFTWITSIHLPRHSSLPIDLVHRFPNLTVINVTAVIRSIARLLKHANTALALIFLFALAASVLVLLAALEAGRMQRSRELALLRVLGARHKDLATALATEFLVLGAASGASAGLIASVTSDFIGQWIFHLPAYFNFWLIPAGIALGLIALAPIGLLATLHITRRAPIRQLRS